MMRSLTRRRTESEPLAVAVLVLLGGCGGGGDTPITTSPTPHLAITLSSTKVSEGASLTFTVAALDASNAVVTTYTTTVAFSSSDPMAVLPGNSSLTQGTGHFTVIFKTAGSQTITATDTIGDAVPGISSSISVTRLTPVPFIVQPLSATAAAPGAAGFTLMVSGTGFVANSVVNWNGKALATRYLSQSSLTASVPAANIAAPTTGSITVSSPGGVTSNVVLFPVATPSTTTSYGPSGTFATGAGAFALAIGDFNGDGKPDLAVAGYDSNDVSVLLGNGDGTFKPAVSYPVTKSGASAIAVGDFNGDGALDVAVADSSSGTVGILLGRGEGTFKPAVAYSAGKNPQLVAVGDFNGDGSLDLVIANNIGGQLGAVTVLLGNGDGTFKAPAAYQLADVGAIGLAVGDFHGDGILDLVVLNDEINILLWNGDGTFQPPKTYSIGGTAVAAVAVADFNGDGKLDLVVGVEGGASVLLGNGDGTFETPVIYEIGGSYAQALAVADVNNDGKLDIVASGYGIGVLLGKGDGTFQPAEVSPAAPQVPSCCNGIGLGDFEGDGRLDIAAGLGSVIALFREETSVTVAPSALDFNTQLVGVASSAQALTVTNTGMQLLAVSSISVTGTDGGDFKATNTCGAALQLLASCKISVVFTPSQTGPRSATLVIPDVLNGARSIGLAGVGIVTGPNATLAPTSLSFGPQLIGTTSTGQTVSVANNGTAPVNITGIAASANFTVASPTCTFALAPGTNCLINVSFTPVGAGDLNGTLSITDSVPGTPPTVALNGIGAKLGQVKLAPSSMTFVPEGCFPPGGLCWSAPETATLTNTGTVPVYVLGEGFRFGRIDTNDCPAPPDALAPSQSCTFTLRVNNSRYAPKTFNVYDTAAGNPQEIAVTVD